MCASLVAQMIKNLPEKQETQVQSPGWENPLEKGMATHSSILAGEFRGQRRLVGYSPWGCMESDTAERLALSLSSSDCLSSVFQAWCSLFSAGRRGHPAQSLEKQGEAEKQGHHVAHV